MVDLSSALTTTLTGIFGVIVGAITSNYVNQKVAAKSARREIIFRKKIEYFESIVTCVKKNTKLYSAAIKSEQKNNSSKKISNLLARMKKERYKFDAMASPLYFNVNIIAGKIREFVALEKIIFNLFEKIAKKEIQFSDANLEKELSSLELAGSRIIFTMRKELQKS